MAIIMSIALVTQVPDPYLYLTPDSPIAGLQFYSITSPSFAPRCVGQRACAAAVEQGEPLPAGARGEESVGKQVRTFVPWFTSKLILPPQMATSCQCPDLSPNHLQQRAWASNHVVQHKIQRQVRLELWRSAPPLWRGVGARGGRGLLWFNDAWDDWASHCLTHHTHLPPPLAQSWQNPQYHPLATAGTLLMLL